jgi:hypothetical protein
MRVSLPVMTSGLSLSCCWLRRGPRPRGHHELHASYRIVQAAESFCLGAKLQCNSLHVLRIHALVLVQARRLTRLTSALTCTSALLAALYCSIAVLFQNIFVAVPSLWFGVHGYHANLIYKQARVDAPLLQGEKKGKVLAWLLLVGSLLQFYLTVIMTGKTWPSLYIESIPSAQLSRFMHVRAPNYSDHKVV